VRIEDKAGHRLRVQIDSSSFPEYDVNPNTGESFFLSDESVTVEQTVHHDGAHVIPHFS